MIGKSSIKRKLFPDEKFRPGELVKSSLHRIVDRISFICVDQNGKHLVPDEHRLYVWHTIKTSQIGMVIRRAAGATYIVLFDDILVEVVHGELVTI